MVRTYDPNRVIVLIGGIPVGGFPDGTFIKVKRTNDTFEKVVGVSGIISRAKCLDKSGEITLILAQTSMSNDILSAFMVADEFTNSGIVPIAILDISSLSVFVSAFGWIRKPAEVEYSKDISAREWTFDVADIDIFIGGDTGSD